MSDTVIEGQGNIFPKQAVQLARNTTSSCNHLLCCQAEFRNFSWRDEGTDIQMSFP